MTEPSVDEPTILQFTPRTTIRFRHTPYWSFFMNESTLLSTNPVYAAAESDRVRVPIVAAAKEVLRLYKGEPENLLPWLLNRVSATLTARTRLAPLTVLVSFYPNHPEVVSVAERALWSDRSDDYLAGVVLNSPVVYGVATTVDGVIAVCRHIRHRDVEVALKAVSAVLACPNDDVRREALNTRRAPILRDLKLGVNYQVLPGVLNMLAYLDEPDHLEIRVGENVVAGSAANVLWELIDNAPANVLPAVRSRVIVAATSVLVAWGHVSSNAESSLKILKDLTDRRRQRATV